MTDVTFARPLFLVALALPVLLVVLWYTGLALNRRRGRRLARRQPSAGQRITPVLLALGAAVAAIVGFAGAEFAWQLASFIVASAVFFAALRPLAHRLNRVADPQGVGANRLLGEAGIVLDRLGPDQPGLVRIDREEWRAEAVGGAVLEAGAHVEVVEIRGTRVVVRPRAGEVTS